MIDVDTLYKELQADFDLLAGPLFEFAELHVRKRDVFLPFGAILKPTGEITIEYATSGEEMESCLEVLPILQEGLRAIVKQGDITALAICEWVKIRLDESEQTDAIKVLVEHVKGLTVAFYVPCHKTLFGGWVFEEMFARQCEAEVAAWTSNAAS
jgi:hypothetical protein